MEYWKRYGVCALCGAISGEPCRSRKASGTMATLKPHTGRRQVKAGK